MRKLIVAEFLSLDGVIEASQEWQPPYFSEDVAKELQMAISAAEVLLLGRITYELFAAYWPTATNDEFGIADTLNSQRKVVVSSTLKTASWNNTTLITGDVAEEVRRLKQQPGGNIRLIGSGTLARSLIQAELVDEYWFLIHPVVVGRGQRLFLDGMQPASLALIESKPFRSGVVLLRYQLSTSGTMSL